MFRRRTPGTGTAGVAATVVLLAVTVTACTGGEPEPVDVPSGEVSPPADQSSGSPGGTGSDEVDLDQSGSVPEDPLTVPEDVAAQSRAATTRYLQAVSAALGDPAGTAALPRDAIGGAARRGIEAQLQDYASRGWSVVGTPVLVGQEVYVRQRASGTLVVGACVDSSDVRVVDGNGDTVPGAGSSSPTARNLFLIEDGPQGPRVVQQSFRDDPSC
ncbi:MAG: hypothetical protein WA966_10035 [Ornithinimicrobium sp.]